MLGRLLCTISMHQPDMRFRRVRGHRVVHCSSCGRELIEEARGRWRPSSPDDYLRA